MDVLPVLFVLDIDNLFFEVAISESTKIWMENLGVARVEAGSTEAKLLDATKRWHVTFIFLAIVVGVPLGARVLADFESLDGCPIEHAFVAADFRN